MNNSNNSYNSRGYTNNFRRNSSEKRSYFYDSYDKGNRSNTESTNRKEGFSKPTNSRYNKQSNERGFRSNSSRSYSNFNSNRSSRYGRNGRSSGRGRFSQTLTEDKFIRKAVLKNETQQFVPTFLFSDLKLDEKLKFNISSKGFVNPTPVQDEAIKPIIEGKDVLGIANTGTGKTAAFLIPLVQKVINNRQEKVIIIVPTRELAEQINEELYLLTKGTHIYSVQCIGGASITNQIYNLRRGYNFIIGTPGRLKDLLERRMYDLSKFNTVVLDEVDRMLDMGFIDDIKRLISFLPKERQSLFFSATVDSKVEQIINLILKPNHIRVMVKTGETADNVNQDVVHVINRDDKIVKLKEILVKEEVQKTLIFVNTKSEVDNLDRNLYKEGFSIESIHGDRRQRERKRAIDKFKYGKVNILIATDVAARGLDIADITHVINYDVPNNFEDYIHRIGRTGRANKYGYALTFVEKRVSTYSRGYSNSRRRF